MGGQSHSRLSVAGGVGTFAGTCAIVPFLHAPGFCKIQTEIPFLRPTHYPDASKWIDGALYLEARSTTASYTGFKVEIRTQRVVLNLWNLATFRPSKIRPVARDKYTILRAKRAAFPTYP